MRAEPIHLYDENDPRECTSRLFTVYYSPTDFPGKFVVREWRTFRGDSTVYASRMAISGDTIEEVREHIPKTMTCIARFADDHPHIVESWI